MIVISQLILGIVFVVSVYFSFRDKKQFVPYFIIPILLFIISEPLLYDKYIDGVDAAKHLYIVNGLYENIISSVVQIPYRINYVILYGNQQPIFYHMTACYLFVLFRLLKLSEIYSYNIMLLIFQILPIIFMYITSYRLFKKNFVALASSLMYLCNLYRVESFYTIIRLGEIQAFIFIPLFILAVYEILFGDKKKVWLLVISASLIYQSHMLSTYLYFMLFTVLFIIYVIKVRDIDRIRVLLFGSMITIFINMWYFIPQLYEMLFVDFYNPMYLDGYLQFKEAISLSTFITTNMSMFIIICIFIVIVLAICLLRNINRKVYNNILSEVVDLNKTKLSILFMCIGLFYQILIFDFVPLEALLSTIFAKLLYVLQFRTRFNLISIPFISLGFPYIFKNIFDIILKFFNNKIMKKIVVYVYIATITFIVSLSSFKYMNNYWTEPNLTIKIFPTWSLDYFLNNISSGSLGDFKYNNDILLSSDDIEIHLDGDGTFNNRTDISFDYYVEDYKDKSILLPLYSYPVYKVVDENNNVVETKDGYNRLIEIELTKSRGSFKVCQYEPPLWLFGDIVSLITFISIVVFYILQYIRSKKNAKVIA